MQARRRWLFCASLAACGVALGSDDHAARAEELELSAPLRELLRTEMTGQANLVQLLASALAAGEWSAIRDAAAKLKSINFVARAPAVLRKEIDAQVPPDFLAHHRALHARADGLRAAAAAQDPQAAGFAYFRLLESCIECHAEYAPNRFPGLAGKVQGQHRD